MIVKNRDSHTEIISSARDATDARLGEKSDDFAESCCKSSGGRHKEITHRGHGANRPGEEVTASFAIGGMSCMSCARKVEEALSEVPGVIRADVKFARREAQVSFNPDEVNNDDLKAVLEAVGYRLLEGHGEVFEEAKDSLRRLAGLRPYMIGVTAAIGVVGFYLGLLTLTSDWYNARSEFSEYGVWIAALAAGLGIQATLFSFLRAWHQGGPMKAAKCSMVASGGMSTTAMAACCAHYLSVLLPALGLPFLSAAAAGLADYQTYFFLAGVLSNLFGIGLMLRMMDRSGMIQIKALFNHLNFGLPYIKR